MFCSQVNTRIILKNNSIYDISTSWLAGYPSINMKKLTDE